MTTKGAAPIERDPISGRASALKPSPQTETSAWASFESTDGSILMAGAGNWLLASDRIGPRVLETANGRYGSEVELCDIGSTALALLDRLHGQDLLLIVDACVGHGSPGEVFVIEPDLSATPARGTSTHQIGPVESLIIARHLQADSMPSRILLVLVETDSFTQREEDEACARVMEVLDGEIDRWRRQRIQPSSPTATTGGKP